MEIVVIVRFDGDQLNEARERTLFLHLLEHALVAFAIVKADGRGQM